MSETSGSTGNIHTTQSADDGRPHLVELRVPADTRHAATARVVAASMAADIGFDIDDIDDLRLAVNEAVAVVLDAPGTTTPGGGLLEIRFRVEGRRIDIAVERRDAGAGAEVTVTFDELADRILTAVVDRHEIVDGVIQLSKTARDAG